jgi:hypothetical protein
MKTPEHIEKIVPDRDGLDFDALRKAGIAMLQELCGEKWTDYNLHDPGVTILEQLCYGITDLAYRSEFAPEDYLAGPFGKIDFTRHALHPADEILPSQVLTAGDYRKIIYDRIPEIEDIWLVREQTAVCSGLYRISLKIRETIQNELEPEEQAQLEERVRQQVIEVYNAHRNLGEDLDEVVIIGSQPVFLCGDIQIHSLRDPASIFADIFFRCALQVISGFRVERYLDARDSGITLDEMFSGPLTVHGRIAATGSERPGALVPIARLIALVQAVDGVKHVQRLALCDENGQPVQLDQLDGRVLRLRFPDKPQSTFLRLHFASNAVGHYDTSMAAAHERSTDLQEEKARIVLDDARIALRKARFEFDTVRNTPQSLEQIVPAPEGVQRSLRDYYSIQHQFPAIYGINRFGVPASAPLTNKVSASQLKAYLFLAEQLMANYLENLQEIPQVFSLDNVEQTYFSQVLDDEALPHIENLYVGTLPQIGAMLSQMVARQDQSEDRRSRLIDVMLAMYGEEFSQKSLRRFNYYEDRNLARWLVDNKLAFLRQIAGLSRDRATAFDYTKGSHRDDGSANLSGLHSKIAILLDLRAAPGSAPLSQELLKYRLRLGSAAELSADNYAGAMRHLARLATAADEVAAEVVSTSEEQGHESTTQHAAGGAILPASLLIQGVRLENYIFEQHGETIHVHFQTHDPRLGIIRLSHYPDLVEADLHVQQLRSFICRLNIGSEGFYLLEHLLLRPRGDASADDDSAIPLDSEFYSSRISVVFPAWSARFSDPDFRNLAQETVCRNLPAHLYPEFHWLDFIAMRDFEQRHRLWLEKLRRHAERDDLEQLNSAAASVTKFLQRQRSTLNTSYWI